MNAKKITMLGCLLFSISSYAAINYQLVTVGDPGNISDPSSGHGQVNYTYRIGKYTVTIAQYTEFLNAIAVTDEYDLYTTNMETIPSTAGIHRTGSQGSYNYTVINNGGDSGNRPIGNISWFNVARFANWLANGEPIGTQVDATTEDGAYTLNGKISGTAVHKNVINPNTGSPPTYYIPTEDEWYKAAYYSQSLNSGSGGYYVYATQSNDPPGNQIGSAANQVNYISNANGYCTTSSFDYSLTQNYLTDVGAFTNSASYYGTYDQTGNVWEWNDLDGLDGSYFRAIRGGAFTSVLNPYITSGFTLYAVTNNINPNAGFRLSAPV